MPEQERLAFEKEMATDEALRGYVAEIRIILQEVETEHLRQAMERFHEGIPDTKTLPPTPYAKRIAWWPWAVAASLVFTFGLWMLIGRPSSNERLFSAYYEPDPGLVTAMGVSDQYEFDRAMVDYKMGQYQSAIERWQKLLQQKPKNDTLNYFLGTSYLASTQGDKALAYFRKTLEEPNSIFTDDAWWYLGLTYLQLGEIDNARQALSKTKKPQAKKLMEELAGE